jgi:hypothetical protein
MKRYMSLIVVPVFALAACGDDNGGGGTDTTGSDGTTSPDGETTSPPGTSQLTGVNTNVQVTVPQRNANCDDSRVDNATHGARYPWGGLTAGERTFTCNRCPSGLGDFQGMWRAHGFAADQSTPDYNKGSDAANDDAELLFIDGNTWYSRLHDHQSGQSVETRGWFVCTQQPEHPNEHLFWVTLQATPAGVFGANAGDINESDVILSSGTDKKLIAWYDDVGGNTSVQIGYCKIGTQSGSQTCNNPFN